MEPEKKVEATPDPEQEKKDKDKDEWTTIRIKQGTAAKIREMAERFHMSQAEVLKSAIMVMPDAMLGMDRYTWLFLDQTLNRLEETLSYNMALRESLEDLVFELVQVEKELSFNLDDLNDSFFAPKPEAVKNPDGSLVL